MSLSIGVDYSSSNSPVSGSIPGNPNVLSIPMQRQEWRAAVNFARALAGVDTTRVIAWGTSFAGGHVLHFGSSPLES